MSKSSAAPEATRRWMRPLGPRDVTQEHRPATALELFFDLCFVVAVAQASSSLHHALAEEHLREALIGFPSVFFAIWWAWMNFTWFASAYDNDDVPYRLAVLVQITGALIMAAGVPRAFDDHDFGVVTLGYAVMRAALVAQWLRAARSDPERRRTDTRYAVGVGACMVGWIVLLVLPDAVLPVGFVVMVVAELAVPVWAERPSATTWHPRHITERYGLFTLIVLGESVLAASIGIQSALDAGQAFADLADICAGGVLIVFAMWWAYFALPADQVVEHARAGFGLARRESRESFVWGYGHYVVFTSAAAVGAGLAVAVDEATGDAEITARGAALAVAIPVALYLLSVWALHARALRGSPAQLGKPLAALAVVVVAAVGLPIVAIAAVLVVLTAVTVVSAPR
jgi:low temperature requirement protein LtrA